MVKNSEFTAEAVLKELENKLDKKEIKILWDKDDYYSTPRIHSLYCGDIVENKEVYKVELLELLKIDKNVEYNQNNNAFLSLENIEQIKRENDLAKNQELLQDFTDETLIKEMRRRRNEANAVKNRAKEKEGNLEKGISE